MNLGATELQMIAEVLGGLGDTTVTGVIWYLGYGLIHSLLVGVIVATVCYGLYKLANRLINQSRDHGRLKEIGALVNVDVTSYYATWQELKREVHKQVTSHEANVETIKRQNADLATYDRMVARLEMDLEESNKQRDAYQQALLHIEGESIAAAKENNKDEEK